MKKMEYKTPEIEELQFVVEGGFNESYNDDFELDLNDPANAQPTY